jgi:hypothetical protein
MVEDDAIEQRVVLALNRAQIAILVERAGACSDVADYPIRLFLQRFHTRWKKAIQVVANAFLATVAVPLLIRESASRSLADICAEGRRASSETVSCGRTLIRGPDMRGPYRLGSPPISNLSSMSAEIPAAGCARASLKNPFGALEFPAAMWAETLAASVDEVLNHADGGAQSLW